MCLCVEEGVSSVEDVCMFVRCFFFALLVCERILFCIFFVGNYEFLYLCVYFFPLFLCLCVRMHVSDPNLCIWVCVPSLHMRAREAVHVCPSERARARAADRSAGSSLQSPGGGNSISAGKPSAEALINSDARQKAGVNF